MKDTFCYFTNLEDATEAQNYDHLFQKAFNLAMCSGVNVSIIKELGLHLEENGKLPLDKYILDNKIIVENDDLYQRAKEIWTNTSAWAVIYKYGDGYVYFKDHSDRTYDLVIIEDTSELKDLNDSSDLDNINFE